MSRFSPYSYAEKVAARVILIDGATLASLLVKHNIGAQNSETFVLKRNRAGQLVIPSALGALAASLSAAGVLWATAATLAATAVSASRNPPTFHRVQHADRHPRRTP